ncbi:DUF123 domain-containing protein [Candidatus Bathyarchaeota archaeon]|nr:DUF123 domain-containing protein [Candidatus Bathyarchaeota archaeon]
MGALGYVRFDEGFYVYVGSALGSKAQSLENRLRRHLSNSKRVKWHIDFLLSSKNVSIERVIVCKTVSRVECLVAKEIAKTGLYNPQLRGFGSSDCKLGCLSHIICLGDSITIEEAAMKVLNAYTRLSLKAEILTSEQAVEKFSTTWSEDLRGER